MNRRKSTRLRDREYWGQGLYFFTICCALRRPYLADVLTAEAVEATLLRSAESNHFTIHAYCLMPDHVHILAEGTSPSSNALGFIRHFKQGSGYKFKQARKRVLWEFSYYDHILRSEDSLIEVARYIWWNPVRKGLSRAPGEYRYSGSQTLSWMQECEAPSQWFHSSHGRV